MLARSTLEKKKKEISRIRFNRNTINPSYPRMQSGADKKKKYLRKVSRSKTEFDAQLALWCLHIY